MLSTFFELLKTLGKTYFEYGDQGGLQKMGLYQAIYGRKINNYRTFSTSTR
jgi:hypothetical protein